MRELFQLGGIRALGLCVLPGALCCPIIEIEICKILALLTYCFEEMEIKELSKVKEFFRTTVVVFLICFHFSHYHIHSP